MQQAQIEQRSHNMPVPDYADRIERMLTNANALPISFDVTSSLS